MKGPLGLMDGVDGTGIFSHVSFKEERDGWGRGCWDEVLK